MSKSDTVREMHARATRGDALTAEEQVQLDQWYAQQDRDEAEGLAPGPQTASLAKLREQVTRTAAELVAETQRIQRLAADNEALRRDIAALQGQLAQRTMAGRA
jgi:hypothetical protein